MMMIFSGNNVLNEYSISSEQLADAIEVVMQSVDSTTVTKGVIDAARQALVRTLASFARALRAASPKFRPPLALTARAGKICSREQHPSRVQNTAQ